MRVSGAIKSILHGVTTNNLKNASSKFFKSQVNLLPRIDEGLVKRPPTEFITSMGATLATDGTEFVKDFVIHDVAYFVVFRASPQSLEVYREDGQVFVVDDLSDGSYLDGVIEADIDLVVQGESIFILNKTKPVLMLPDDKAYLEHSLLYIKSAVEQGTQIWLTAEDHLSATHTVTYTVPATLAATGADAVAKQLALLVNALANFTSTNRGASLNVLRTDGKSAQLTLSSTIGQAPFVIMNGVVDSVDDLPRYAYDGAVTKIQLRTDTDRTDFWMEADAIASYDQVAEVPPVWPAGDLVNKTPVWGKFVTGVFTTAGVTAPVFGVDTERHYLVLEAPGSINSKIVERIWLQRWESYMTSYSQMFTLHNITFVAGQVPDGGEHEIRWANTLNDEVTVLSRQVTRQYDSAKNQYVWQNNNGIELIGEIWSTANAYDLWADADVDNAGVAGDLVEVRWEERAEPGIDLEFSAETMPHVLRPGVEGFDFQAVTWDARAAGTDREGSNPKPAFVGKVIEDLTIFQDRLCFLSEDEVSMSASRNVFNFFRDTTTQLLSKHPINVRTTSPKSSKLRHFVFHNRDLFITAGRQQFKIAGSQPATPQTTSMVLTTAYNASETISPISLGNSIYIPSHFGKYLNVSKYDGSTQNLEPDAADNITQHARKFIQGTITKLHGLPNHGLIFLHSSVGSDIYICNYDTEVSRNEDRRFAWLKWDDLTDKTYNIASLATSKNTLILAINTTAGLDLLTMDIDAGSDKKYMDYQQEFTGVTTTVNVGATYGVSISEIKVVQGAGCPEPGDYVGVTSLVAGVLTLDTNMSGGAVTVGREFLVSGEPNLLQVRDEGGFVNSAANLRIQGFNVSLVDTGIMEATEQSPYDTYDAQEFTGIVSNSLDAITDTAVTTTDSFLVGFKQKADVGTVKFTSTSWLPLTISQIDWRGNYTSRGRRF